MTVIMLLEVNEEKTEKNPLEITIDFFPIRMIAVIRNDPTVSTDFRCLPHSKIRRNGVLLLSGSEPATYFVGNGKAA